jgi:hypothetical protein
MEIEAKGRGWRGVSSINARAESALTGARHLDCDGARQGLRTATTFAKRDRPMPKPNLTFVTLREIAESASGMRDQDLWFVVTGDPVRYTWSTKPVHAGDDTEVIYVAAVKKDPVSLVDCAMVGVPGHKPVDLLGITIGPIAPHPGGTYAADAVFWSVSAVEKFLVPYYASVYGDQGPDMAQAVLDVLLRGVERAGDEEDEAPFAVAHLPSSEYVGEPEADPSFVPRLAALHPGGHVRRVRLARAQGR